jgi:hypothetical protein
MDPLYVKMFLTGCAAGVVCYLMERAHRRRVERAEREFQMTLAAIEARNRIHPAYRNDTRKDK